MENEKLSIGMKIHSKYNYDIEFSDIITIKPGDVLQLLKYSKDEPGWVYCRNLEGQEGWVPESSFTEKNDINKTTEIYSSQELQVQKGDLIII